jgi:phage baseplate assembly protein W
MPDDGPESLYTSFLGKGWSFPPEFVKGQGVAPKGEVLMTEDEDDIRTSLQILFGTAEGERFLNPKYGLRMDDQVFEPMGTTARTYLKDRVRTAILIYEPRINLIALELDTSRDNEGVIAIVMDYVVRTTNSRFNLVYPFYRHDANEVRGRTPVRIARAAPAA